MKKITISIAGLITAIIFMGIIQEVIWHQFDAPQIVGAQIEGNETDQTKACTSWFYTYTNQLKGLVVPYDYRIRKASIDRAELLEPGYIQLDYSIWPVSANNNIVMNLELINTENRGRYQGQMVLRLEENLDGYQIAEKMRPAAYQLQTPEMVAESQRSQTQHYKMSTDTPMTYFVNEETLYVTYDSGENSQQVPDGYESVCKEWNGTYNEQLAANSYIITSEFTAFVAYTDEGVALLYSRDQGNTWAQSQIFDGGYKVNTFLSKAGDNYHVTFAVDRSLGSDYYGSFVSKDLTQWNSVNIPTQCERNISCVFWSEEGLGYFANRSEPNIFYLTKNQGTDYEERQYPQAEQTANVLGYQPFDTLEEMYQEDGSTYMIVGQGDDADYAKDGKPLKALYQSTDGENFVFVREIADAAELAG